jgi:hypothetical protein
MTKIALSPNASGTGTFTIEAPNSNSNRTLVLPDAAGEIVAEAAGNEVYKKQNILGTVSQSAGVPTGAIIERGSNANGEFVKYADGTMICFNEQKTGGSGGSGGFSVSLPATFINGDYSTQISDRFDSGGSLAGFVYQHHTQSGSSFNLRGSLLTSGAVGNNLTGRFFSFIVIGRWF